MTRLRLTLSCDDYDRTRALWDGSVQPEGIEINYVKADPGESFWRMLQHGEFDASELSMSALIMLVGRQDRGFVAIPAFTSRAFRHDCIFVNPAAGIKAPADLKGRKIGVPQFHMTAALWIRGMLHHEYGVRTEEIEWVQGGLNKPGYPERIALSLPPSIHVTPRQDRSLSSLLLDGEIDGIIGAEWPAPFLAGDSRIVRLFPDFRERDRDYYRRTGFFPIMHCIALRRDIYEQNRWAAQNLYLALVKAKERAYVNIGLPGALKYMLPWHASDYREAVELMGEDYWRYGVEQSRHELDAMCQYAFEQGLSSRLVSPNELFAPETVNQFGQRRDP